jgi:hypothetical protein
MPPGVSRFLYRTPLAFMSAWRDRIKNGLLNALLLSLGLGVIVLAYALVTRTTQPQPEPSRAEPSAKLVGDIIQVEVLNGAGVDHLAWETTQFLRDQGFDVVNTGNARSFDYEQSVVIDRIGDLESARRVARALEISPDRVRQEVRTDYYLDASVILGDDYRTLRPFRNGLAPAETAPPKESD